MAVIAVAGGTGGVGKTIVETLAQEPKFQVVVLSRNVRSYNMHLIISGLINR